MIDCTKYSEKAFLQLLKQNDLYQHAIAKEMDWDKVVGVINSLGLKYTESQIQYVYNKQWIG